MSDSPQRGRPGQREFDADDFEMVPADTSCHDCEHQRVCAVYNRFAAVVVEATNDEQPIVDPAELAKICPEYAPRDE